MACFSSLFRPIGLFALLFAVCGCDAEQTSTPKPAGKIMAQQVCAADIHVSREFSGRASAALVAEIRPQVDGIVKERLFVEGSHVAAGDVLYRIDRHTYQAAYDKAKGELALANADLEAAAKRVARRGKLIKSKAVSQQDLEDARAEYARIKAQIATMEAALSSAAIDLERTNVRAPISGYIGRSAITPGALVVASQGEALATIKDLEKIYVDVKIPVADWLELRSDPNAEKQPAVSVYMKMENGEIFSSRQTGGKIKGEMLFTDMEVNPLTGTINMRATFPNPDEPVPHGMYARLLLDKTVKNAILIPARAVRHDVAGDSFVMVLSRNTDAGEYFAVKRKISAGSALPAKILVKEGLNDGEKIVIDGFVEEGRPISPVNIIDMEADCPNMGAL